MVELQRVGLLHGPNRSVHAVYIIQKGGYKTLNALAIQSQHDCRSRYESSSSVDERCTIATVIAAQMNASDQKRFRTALASLQNIRDLVKITVIKNKISCISCILFNSFVISSCKILNLN